jgi:hypothetical protein
MDQGSCWYRRVFKTVTGSSRETQVSAETDGTADINESLAISCAGKLFKSGNTKKWLEIVTATGVAETYFFKFVFYWKLPLIAGIRTF